MAANDVPCCETMFWVYLVICVALVCFAGLMSGLTLGLMSLSLVDLEVLIKAGKPEDKKNAEKILPIVKNQHLLLCTLLIWNALAMEALPIFVDALLPAWGAILISVTLILAFGEIIPQSVCSRYGLNIGARLSVVVRLLVIIVFPISYPISKLLDLLLGKGHSALLRRAELKTLVDMHGNEAGKGGELSHNETTIISGALDLTAKTAKDAMTPLSSVFSLDLNAELNNDMMSLIMSNGHSRVPVYMGSPANIVGLVLVKNLIKCRPEDGTLIRNLTIRRIPRVHECLPLYDILNQFQKGQSHMAVVVKSTTPLNDDIESATSKSVALNINVSPRAAQRQRTDRTINVDCLVSIPRTDEQVLGIITMEDVLEELLQEPIYDETDEYVDLHNQIKINMIPCVKMSSQSPGKTHSSTASPYTSRHQTAIMRSPLSPYIQSPIISSSAGNSSSASPAGSKRPHQGSPSTILQLITPRHFTKPNPWPEISRHGAPFSPPRTWRIHDGAKGFSNSSPKGGARKGNTSTTNENRRGGGDDDDDKIPDVVWERMIPRILFYVGVPLAIGFALLKGFDVVIENGSWNVPKWVPFLTTFITFGASALGIAYGSLSTSLDAAEEGSLLGFEQVQKNWVEMWKEEDGA